MFSQTFDNLLMFTKFIRASESEMLNTKSPSSQLYRIVPHVLKISLQTVSTVTLL